MIKTFVSLLLCVLGQFVYGQSVVPVATAVFQTGGPIRSAIVHKNDRIYFTNLAGSVFCIDRDTHNLVWQFKTDGAIAAAPSVTETTVVVSSRDNHIYALDAKDGVMLWKYQMSPALDQSYGGWEYFAAQPEIYDDIVLAGSGDGYLYALNLHDGRLNWKYQTAGRIRTAPLVDGQTIYQPSNDSFIHVIDAKTGKPKWKYATLGTTYDSRSSGFNRTSMYDTPTKAGESIIFGSRDGNVYSVNLKTQEANWKFSYGTTWAMSSTVDKNTVYVGWSTNDLVSAVDVETGEERWKFQAGAHNYTKPLVINENVYFGSADGRLYKLNKANGDSIWSYSTGSEIYGSPVRVGKKIYVGNDNGSLFAIEEQAKAHLAVYHPDTITDITQYLVVDQKLTPFLTQKGFSRLDEKSLTNFIESRIKDGVPSVIVFSLPVIPSKVIGEKPQDGLMRKYLDSGGKVVWMGDVPNFYALNSDGQYSRSQIDGEILLGVTYPGISESGNYFSQSSQLGKNWGLPDGLKTTGAIVAIDKNMYALARDEYGRPSAWIKKFHPRAGSGYVSCRTWSWNVPITKQDLEITYKIATYGIK